MKTKFSNLTMPSRSLYSTKSNIKKASAEANVNEVFEFAYAEPQPVFDEVKYKKGERRGK